MVIGILPEQVKMMIQRKHGLFNDEKYSFHYHSGKDSFDFACNELAEVIA